MNTGSCGNPPAAGVVYSWGPNGHPLMIGTFDSHNTLHNEILHWSGDQLLFATGQQNNSAVLDDIKIDTQGDVLPRDPSTPGLVFFDRGPAGMVMGCHNASNATFGGFGDAFGGGWLGAQDTQPCYQQAGGLPTSINWYGTSLIYGTNLGLPIGQGGALGMPRIDGFTDNADTVQGVRAYSSTAGTWTTPDAYAGVTTDPMSQKPYIWNNNNPLDYADLTGLTTYLGQAWMGRIPFIFDIHAFIQVVEGGMNVTKEYGPEGGMLEPFSSLKDATYGSSISSFHKTLVVLDEVNGLSGKALDDRVLSVFGEIDRFLSSNEVCYCQYNSNSIIAAGLFLLGASPLRVSELVTGPGAGIHGNATQQGEILAKLIVSQSASEYIGYSLQFVLNSQQAEDFQNWGNQFIY